MITKLSFLFSKIRTFAFIGVVFVVLLIATTAITASGANAAPFYGTSSGVPTDTKFDKDDAVECDWKSASIIVCSEVAFAFDPVASVNATKPHAIFRMVLKGGGDWKGKPDLTEVTSDWYIHLENSEKGTISKDASDAGTRKLSQITSDDQAAKKLELATDADDPDNPTGSDTIVGGFNKNAQRHKYGDNGLTFYAMCGLYAKKGQQCYNASSTNGYAAPFNKYSMPNDEATDIAMVSIRKSVFSYMDSREDCGRDAGSLSFILCPILSTTKTAVNMLIGGEDANGTGKGFLVELLTVSPLSSDTGQNVYKLWEAFRNIAMGLYILIFVAIIFGNGLGFDPYTIKRALPRLAAAVLLTFASYFILQTLVDLSNLVGTAAPALIQSISGSSGITAFQFDLNSAEAGLTIVLAILFALAALGALIIGIAGLVARQMIIYALILVAPLAFAAWVLPNTESLFKKWWSNLLKVLAMFPIITGMLAIAIMYSDSVSSDSSLAVKISGMLAPMIALIMIPKTFKWGGELFAAGAGFIAGRASKGVDMAKGGGKALQGGAKNMAQNKIIQSNNRMLGGNSRVGGFLAGAGAGSLTNSRGGRLRRAANVSRVQGEIEKATSVRYDQAMSGATKPVRYGTPHQKADEAANTAAQQEAFGRLIEKAPREERFAYAAKAAKSGNASMIGMAADKMGQQEYGEFVTRNYGDFADLPDYRSFDVASAKGGVVRAKAASGGVHTPEVAAAESKYRTTIHGKMGDKNSAAISGAKAGAQKEMFYTTDASGNKAVDHAAIASMDSNQLQNLITDKTQRGNLTKDTLDAFREHAYYTDPATGAVLNRTGAHAAAIRAGLQADGTFI